MVLANLTAPAEQLREVFGEAADRLPLEELFRSATYEFVKSQVQIALATEAASGRRLSTSQVLSTFGWDVFYRAVVEGSCSIATTPNEPAQTLRLAREALGLSAEDVSHRARVRVEQVIAAERPGALSSIKVLEKIAEVLAVDERLLGVSTTRSSDHELGFRLREISHAGRAGFGAGTVFSLTEAAWVVSRQADLTNSFGVHRKKFNFPEFDSNYSFPAHQRGYDLARRTRQLIGVNDHDPIESVRVLIEDGFGIPLVQLQMNARFAGATIANGASRGIVVNEAGRNSNVWVRRMTLCHELGHFLWDSDEHLRKLRVDEYDELDSSDTGKPVEEIRANAFAVAFLAPPDGVELLSNEFKEDDEQFLGAVAHKYGISGTAARRHIENVTSRKINPKFWAAPQPEEGWEARENLTLDFFPMANTPVSRRGRFSWLVGTLMSRGAISVDCAAAWLKCSIEEVEVGVPKLLELWGEVS